MTFYIIIIIIIFIFIFIYLFIFFSMMTIGINHLCKMAFSQLEGGA